jgi:hypothetical protein
MSDVSETLAAAISAQFLGDVREAADKATGVKLHDRMRAQVTELLSAVMPCLDGVNVDTRAAILMRFFELLNVADQVETIEEAARPRSRRELRDRRFWGRLTGAVTRALRSA